MIRISYRGMNIRLITNVLDPIWCLIIHRHCIFENNLDCVVINLKDALVIILQNPVHTGPKLLHHIYIMEDSHDFSVSWSANSCKEHLP